MKLRILGSVALMACALASCSTIQSLEGAKITPTVVVTTGNGVDAIEQTATNYLKAPLCKKGQTFFSNGCRVSAATQPIGAAVHSLTTARTNLEAFYAGHYNGPLGAKGLIDAVSAATSTLQTILKNYGVQS